MLIDYFLRFFTSLRLTVVILFFAMFLVFFGTMGQESLGLYGAQEKYFRSWLVVGSPLRGVTLPIILPGGYLLGGLLLINLVAAHLKRLKFSRHKLGLFIIHAGLILLLLGQLASELLSVESSMRLVEGQASNYSQDFRANEMVVIDSSGAESDRVISLPEGLLVRQQEIRLPQTQLTLRVKKYWLNSHVSDAQSAGARPVEATQGIGTNVFLTELPQARKTDERDLPSALVELVGPGGSLGTWLVSSQLLHPQTFTHEGKTHQLALRFLRHYKPFTLQLLDFRHDKYQGTDIPKNFSSRVRLENPQTREEREVLIYMNNPLRYQGETFYQASFDPNDERISILQVVGNPSWLTPYVACALVGFGLLTQFVSHLGGFLNNRKRSAA